MAGADCGLGIFLVLASSRTTSYLRPPSSLLTLVSPMSLRTIPEVAMWPAGGGPRVWGAGRLVAMTTRRTDRQRKWNWVTAGITSIGFSSTWSINWEPPLVLTKLQLRCDVKLLLISIPGKVAIIMRLDWLTYLQIFDKFDVNWM